MVEVCLMHRGSEKGMEDIIKRILKRNERGERNKIAGGRLEKLTNCLLIDPGRKGRVD